MQARVPIKGSLSFLDSRGTPHAMGIDVGAEQCDERAAQPHRGGDAVDGHLELRPMVPDPFTPPGRRQLL